MKANIHTLRATIISLLKKQGYSPIEATERWDRVYSPQIQQTPKGVTKTLIIGQYTLEYKNI